jgi:hypothetical protein
MTVCTLGLTNSLSLQNLSGHSYQRYEYYNLAMLAILRSGDADISLISPLVTLSFITVMVYNDLIMNLIIKICTMMYKYFRLQ